MKTLLALLLLVVAGCYSPEEIDKMERGNNRFYHGVDVNDAEWNTIVKDRKAMLTDGRIHIGMTDDEFARLWGRAYSKYYQIDRSTSAYGVTEWWKYDYHCEPTNYDVDYYFCFENGILDHWSEN